MTAMGKMATICVRLRKSELFLPTWQPSWLYSELSQNSKKF